MNIFTLLRAPLFLLIVLLFSLPQSTPQNGVPPITLANNQISATETSLSLSGPVGGAYLTNLRGADHLESSPARDLRMRQRIRTLQQTGALAPFDASKQVSFIQPIKLVNAPLETSILTAQFVDHDQTNPGSVQDYRCSDRTYDFQGYNHTGTDFVAYPFPWRMIDNDSVTVVAAAAGTIVERSDGHADRNCSFGGTGDNMVVLVHADGSQSSYAHMKKGSVTTKAVGERVEAGEYLGVIGSSGASTAPHLHFEVKDSAGNLIDPFFDPANATCNTLNQSSWWAEQPEYFDAGINKLMTSSARPSLQQCGDAITHDTDSFLPGETVHLSAFYRNQLSEDITQFQLMRPDGSIALKWDHQIGEDYLEFSMWTWSITLDPESPLGAWIVQADYRGETYAHGFAATEERGNPDPTPTPEPTPKPGLDERMYLPLVLR